MEIIQSLINFFGITALQPTATFLEFMVWFFEIIMAVLLVATVITAFFKLINIMVERK